jgi:hypothetical protein
MKIFWSWQSDVPGNIGRHFVRDALAAAIEVLKQPETVEEPSEAERRNMLHLDYDRKGIPGSPDLAPTILKKIEQSAVFIADVTLVGRPLASAPGGKGAQVKRFINSNVAIEYGFALHALTDAAILMVQNAHYGDRNKLPFDLQHKAGPIQYRLAPGASNEEIAAEKARLRGELVKALRPYVTAAATATQAFPEMPATSNPAFFFDRAEVFARVGEPGVDEIAYQFTEPHAFYLRLIPQRDPKFKYADLAAGLEGKIFDTLSMTLGGLLDRNRYGIVSYNPRGGQSNRLRSLSQAFRNGEIWGVSSEFYAEYQGRAIIPIVSVERVYTRVLANYALLAEDAFGLSGPFTVEFGATGLRDMWIGTGHRGVIGPIHDDKVVVRRALNSTSPAVQAKAIDDFLDELFDLAGEDRTARAVKK